MELNRPAEIGRHGAEAEPARSADEATMEKLFPPNVSEAAESSREGLWTGQNAKAIKRDAAGRPKFTHNSRLVNYIRAVMATADTHGDGTATSAKTTRPVKVAPAVHCELGFIIEVLTKQLLVLQKLIFSLA